MAFDLRGFLRFVWRWLTEVPWTWRRALIVVAFLLVYPVLQLFVWVCMLIDNLFFRAYKSQAVLAPVFVIGNFRSGTTRLHRLLAGDTDNFTTTKLWEVLFAPTVTQRYLGRKIARLDRLLGSPVQSALRWIEGRWQQQVVMHEIALTQPEEDEYLLLHIWSAMTIGLSAGVLDEARPYVRFDEDLPERRRRKIMRFYRSCLQRHLYAGDAKLIYLAKNPALTPKIDSLLHEFPDARFIYLVRNPMDAVPSFISMMEFSWRVLGLDADTPELKQFIIDMACYWYRYPLERLAQEPDSRYIVVKYDDLARQPEKVLANIYEHFGLQQSDRYRAMLQSAAAQARDYQTRHEYSVENTGMTQEELNTMFADVMKRYGFDAPC
jgi:hypothetical protein